MRTTTASVLTLAVLALVVGPIGSAVFVLGFGLGDSPCVLCWAQRTMMLLIALVGLFVVRFGPRPRYLGAGVVVAAAGIYMSIRHAALHVGRDIGQGFSLEILGAHTYTWAALIFWAAVMLMGALIATLDDAAMLGRGPRTPGRLRPIERVAAWLFLVVTAANALQAFVSTGPPPFMGQSDPVRFSWDPRHWVWSLEEWKPAPVSLRGRWDIEKPDVSRLPADPARSPFAGLPLLSARKLARSPLPPDGLVVTDLAYDAQTNRFLFSTEHGLAIVDGALRQVERQTTIDPGYSVDLSRFGGAAFLDDRTIMAVAENKSYVVLKETDAADPVRNHRFFLDSFDRFDEVTRGRFATVRARMMYVLSLAYDSATNSLYTLSVPNARVTRLVVSRFDRGDLMLSEEFSPSLGSHLALKPEQSTDSLVVTGAAFGRGRLYALSASCGTLVAIDPARRAIVAAYAVGGLDRPAGLAIKGDDLYIVSENGTLSVATLPPDEPPRP